MTVRQIIETDFRKEEGRKIIQKALKKIGKFAEYEEDVPISEIERFIFAVTRKYQICVQYLFFPKKHKEVEYYCADIKRDDNDEWISAVYAVQIYEMFAKIAILMYSIVKKGEIPKR